MAMTCSEYLVKGCRAGAGIRASETRGDGRLHQTSFDPPIRRKEVDVQMCHETSYAVQASPASSAGMRKGPDAIDERHFTVSHGFLSWSSID